MTPKRRSSSSRKSTRRQRTTPSRCRQVEPCNRNPCPHRCRSSPRSQHRVRLSLIWESPNESIHRAVGIIFWMYPVFGIRGASWFLGVSEWLFGALLFLGFWDKRLGLLGAAGSTVTFVMTVTIIPFMPNGWATSAGGFPAMTGNVPFLMKDVVLLAASLYLLKQDLVRLLYAAVQR